MRSPLAIRRTIQNARRVQEIVTALARYGFNDAVQELELDRLVQRGKDLLRFRRAGSQLPPEIVRVPQAVRLRKVLEDLGPTFVKLGQVLSLRPDLIPQEWADEFRKLQSDVPPVAFEQIMRVLEAEFPGKITSTFRHIEEIPIAAASIAQVHRAVLADGSAVVLKVLRPGVRDILQTDMRILRYLAEFVEEHFANLGYSPTAVVDQFEKELRRETNLILEARATDRLRRAFLDNENVSFPKVYWEATTSSVMALEEIHGVLLSKVQPGQLSDHERRQIVANGADAVFRQCLEIGFFHADPHPGNIFAMPGGKICFIDCGMTGHIDPITAQRLADLVQGVIAGELDRVIHTALALGDADPSMADNRAFRADVWEFISRFEAESFEHLDMGDLLRTFFDKIREHKLHVPSDLVFLIKAITTIEGVGEQIAPEFDIVHHVRPHVERLVRRRYGIGALRRRLTNSVMGYAELLEDIPRQVESLFYDLRRKRFTVNLEHRGLEGLTNTIEHASGNVAHAVFLAAVIMGSSILVLADSIRGEPGILTTFAGIGFVMAVALALGRVVSRRFRR